MNGYLRCRKILGPDALGLSPANIVRLKGCWEKDYLKWNSRDLSRKNSVYFWVDGIYFNVCLDDEKSCILIIIGADKQAKHKSLWQYRMDIERVKSAGKKFFLT